jgi:D5 protein-like
VPTVPQPVPEVVPALAAKPRRKQEAKATKATKLIALPGPREHAAQFGVSCFKSDPEAELPIIQMHGRYRSWCEENGLNPLPPDTIASELRELFDKAGLPIEARGKDLVVRGLSLA